MKGDGIAETWLVMTGLAALAWPLIQASGADVTFNRITEGELANDAGHYFGVAWGDYDGDGFADLFIGNTGTNHRLYRNNGDGTFGRVTTGAVAEDTPADAGLSAWADYDNDGDLDLFVPNFAATPDRFFRNDGGGEFTRITAGSWVKPTEAKWGNSACWGDVNNDGFVDLFVANTASGSNYLYLNHGDGTMSGGNFPITGNYISHLSVLSDINMDGHVDLLVAQPGMVYHNDGEGNLSPSSDPPFARNTWQDIDLAPADYDNDGDLDLVVVGYLGNRLYLNDGTGGFTEVTEGAIYSLFNSQSLEPSACAAWGDYDNDGKIDLFIARSEVSKEAFTDLLYHNEGNGEFSEVTGIPLVDRYGYSWTAAWADYDNDGDLDLIVDDGNNSNNQGTPAPVALYRNDGGNQNNWCIVALQGSASNGSAFGAKVRLTATIDGESVTQLREINGRNTELRAHFGLGDATVVDELRVEWPSGIDQVMTNIEPNQILEVAEAGWCHDPEVGWKYVYTRCWSQCLWLGLIYEHGNYFYNYHHGWFYRGESLSTACWVYSYAHGWVWLDTANGGWVCTWDGDWYDLTAGQDA
jgi:hypothetical protein